MILIVARKNLELASRDLQIVAMIRAGYSYEEIAGTFGISRARVSQVNKKFQEETGEDERRAALASLLEGWLYNVLQPLVNGPGKLMVTVKGDVVRDENGDPVYDPFPKIDAVDRGVKVLDRLSRLYALDKPAKKPRDDEDDTPAYLEAMAYVQQLAEEKRHLAAEREILAARLRELESGQEEVHDAEIVDGLHARARVGKEKGKDGMYHGIFQQQGEREGAGEGEEVEERVL